MKKITIAAAAVALFAVPAAANAQAYVQAQAGLDSVSSGGASSEGVAYGVAAGYDLQLRNALFVGIQASVADSSTKECVRDLLVVGDKTCIRTGRDLAVVGRIGTNVGDTTKLYVLGGYTNARIRATYSDGTNKASAGANADGFRLGAGFEHDFGRNLFGKVEYNYSNYEGDFSRHYALVGLGVKF